MQVVMARRDWSCALKHRVLGGCGSRDVAGRPTSRSVGVSGGAARRFSLTTEQLARVSQRLNPRRAIERHLRCRLRLRNRRKGSEWTSGRYRRRSIRAVCIAVRGRGRCWLRPRPGTGHSGGIGGQRWRRRAVSGNGGAGGGRGRGPAGCRRPQRRRRQRRRQRRNRRQRRARRVIGWQRRGRRGRRRRRRRW